MKSVLSWFGAKTTQRGGDESTTSSRLVVDAEPAVIYAIGDVHGCMPLLAELERKILADAEAVAGQKWVVMLGDLVDRGPQSAQVLDHCMKPMGKDFRRICLKGNHEAMMLAFLKNPKARSDWLAFGGREALMSYGIPAERIGRDSTDRVLRTLVESHVPDEHVSFLETLPVILETPSTVFSHAGLRPGVPIDAQTETDLLWIRDDFVDDYASIGKLVVHGHMPREEPLLSSHRIAVDTGAYLSGRLTAVRLRQGEAPRLLMAIGRELAMRA